MAAARERGNFKCLVRRRVTLGNGRRERKKGKKKRVFFLPTFEETSTRGVLASGRDGIGMCDAGSFFFEQHCILASASYSHPCCYSWIPPASSHYGRVEASSLKWESAAELPNF